MGFIDDCAKGIGNAFVEAGKWTAGAAVWTGGALLDGAVAVGGAIGDGAIAVGGAIGDGAVAAYKGVEWAAVGVYKGGEALAIGAANLAVDAFNGLVDVTCEAGKAVANFFESAAIEVCNILGVTPEEAVAFLQEVLRDIVVFTVEEAAALVKEKVHEKIYAEAA